MALSGALNQFVQGSAAAFVNTSQCALTPTAEDLAGVCTPEQRLEAIKYEMAYRNTLLGGLTFALTKALSTQAPQNFGSTTTSTINDHPPIQDDSIWGSIKRKTNQFFDYLLEYSPLHRAIVDGDQDFVKKAIKKKLHLNETDKYGNLPLHLAVKAGNVQALELLLKCNEIDQSRQNFAGQTALAIAADKNAHQMINMLLDHTPLVIKTYEDRINAVRILSQYPAIRLAFIRRNLKVYETSLPRRTLYMEKMEGDKIKIANVQIYVNRELITLRQPHLPSVEYVNAIINNIHNAHAGKPARTIFIWDRNNKRILIGDNAQNGPFTPTGPWDCECIEELAQLGDDALRKMIDNEAEKLKPCLYVMNKQYRKDFNANMPCMDAALFFDFEGMKKSIFDTIKNPQAKDMVASKMNAATVCHYYKLQQEKSPFTPLNSNQLIILESAIQGPSTDAKCKI